MKKLVLLLMFAVLGGCASHAEIKMPTLTAVHDPVYENKTLNYEVLYSQPKPGIFSGGEQLPLAPLENAELSVASASTLRDLPKLIFNQLPVSVKHLADNADLTLKLEITAYDKKGPAYSDHEFAKSLGKNLLTLGFASSEYNIVADFDVKYILEQRGKVIFTKDFKVKDEVDHEKGDFDSYNTLNEFTSQMLEKHFTLTLHSFFTEAAMHLKS
ncbi:hypothetical protein A3Q34_12695 [Colwellia sp. PAMC 20917]|uniref:hypothetical protein n=1 Tax=Colwellia sp. PAMC 20917 TaxID=1816218 RepID=UPI000878CF11|nr:hypothetical protein [Colwellia sp. PAMC 20917]AOW77634.1 hypothetical protein A3Q34_12695 [Colwellia sp. PAMC 20917]